VHDGLRNGAHGVSIEKGAEKTPSIQRWLVRQLHVALHPGLQQLAQPSWNAGSPNRPPAAAARHPALPRELTASIRTWIQNWNDDPKPFVWHKTADEILRTSPTTANGSTTQVTSAS